MRVYGTHIDAIVPGENRIATFLGPTIKAFNIELAQEYLENNLPAYYYLTDEIVCEIPCYKTSDGYMYNPDFKNAIHYDGFDPSLN